MWFNVAKNEKECAESVGGLYYSTTFSVDGPIKASHKNLTSKEVIEILRRFAQI